MKRPGRIPTTCCNCFSRETRRTRLGTYYCAPCYAAALAFSRGREGHAAVIAVRV